MPAGLPTIIRGRVSTAWGEFAALRSERGVCRLLSPPETRRKLDAWIRAHEPQAVVIDDDAAFGDLSRALHAYLAGDGARFDVPLDLRGTPFQQRVWRALLRVPAGETRTYAQLAETAGLPGGARAAGAANGANPVCVLVPCHRIVAESGRLVGYAGGLALKKRLLAHERATFGRAASTTGTIA